MWVEEGHIGEQNACSYSHPGVQDCLPAPAPLKSNRRSSLQPWLDVLLIAKHDNVHRLFLLYRTNDGPFNIVVGPRLPPSKWNLKTALGHVKC